MSIESHTLETQGLQVEAFRKAIKNVRLGLYPPDDRFGWPRRLALLVRAESTQEQRQRVLERWYRERLREQVPLNLEKRQPVLGMEAAGCGIRKMKTRWGRARCRRGDSG